MPMIFNILFACLVAGTSSSNYTMDDDTKITLPGIDWHINPRVIKPEHASLGITIVSHGFGGSGDLADYLAQDDIVHGALITFEMVDSTAQGPLPLSKANFGQMNDTKALAAACVYAYNHFKDVPFWNMYGLSRGGATVANVLAQLVCYDQYATHLQSVGMTQELVGVVVAKLKQGTIILDRPLHSISSVIRNKTDEVIDSSLKYVTPQSLASSNFSWWVPWFIKDLGSLLYASSRESIASSVDYTVLPAVTRGNYTPFGPSPLESARIIQPHNFNILVHIQNPDDVLGNDATVADFCKNLRNTNTYYLVKTGTGHNGFNREIAHMFNAFRIYFNTIEDQDVTDERKKIYIENNKSFFQKLQPDDATLTDLVTRKH